jgi:hypothetical protein
MAERSSNHYLQRYSACLRAVTPFTVLQKALGGIGMTFPGLFIGDGQTSIMRESFGTGSGIKKIREMSQTKGRRWYTTCVQWFGKQFEPHPLGAAVLHAKNGSYTSPGGRWNNFMADVDVGEMFLNFILHKDLRGLAGVDLLHYVENPERDGPLWEAWQQAAMGL